MKRDTVLRNLRTRFGAFLAGVALCCSACAFAQAPAPCSDFQLKPDTTQAFDVVAIKPADPARTIVLHEANDYGKWAVEGVTLAGLIEEAYGVADYQVEGMPRALANEHFDLKAKALTGPNGGPVPRYDLRGETLRLRTLLAQRFGLRLSCRVGQRRAAVLTRDPNHAAPPPSTVPPQDGRWREGHGSVTGTSMPFATIAAEASFALDEKVVDETGLKDHYDIDMHWTPATDDSNTPDAVTFEQELHTVFGVNVKQEKRPIAILVVEHAQAPTFD